MSERETDHEGGDHHEGPVSRAIEHLEERHQEHRREADERELREELGAAGFDAASDTGIEADRSDRADFDVEADTGEEVRDHPSVPPLLHEDGSQ
jgi:hypothetical protein